MRFSRSLLFAFGLLAACGGSIELGQRGSGVSPETSADAGAAQDAARPVATFDAAPIHVGTISCKPPRTIVFGPGPAVFWLGLNATDIVYGLRQASLPDNIGSSVRGGNELRVRERATSADGKLSPLAVVGPSFYFVNGSSLIEMPTGASGNDRVVAELPPNVGAVVVSSGSAYYDVFGAGFGAFYRQPLAGGDALLIGTTTIGPLVADDEFVYGIADAGGGSSALQKLPKGGGAATSLAKFPSPSLEVQPLSQDADYLYVFDRIVHAIFRYPKGRGPSKTMAEGDDVGVPTGALVDGGRIYWIRDLNGSRTLMTMPADGGDVQPLVPVDPGAYFLVKEGDTFFYGLGSGSGSLGYGEIDCASQ